MCNLDILLEIIWKMNILIKLINYIIQEKMKIDAIISDTLVGVLDSLNDLKVERKDIVNIFQNTVGQYIAVFYS